MSEGAAGIYIQQVEPRYLLHSYILHPQRQLPASILQFRTPDRPYLQYINTSKVIEASYHGATQERTHLFNGSGSPSGPSGNE